jgi:AraC-like DNA-binding protein
MIAIEPPTEIVIRNFTSDNTKYCEHRTDLRVEQSIAYMEQHLYQPLQVAELAAQAGVTMSHFFALFKRQVGSAPLEYFTRLRMRRACQLLENPLLNVKEVACQLGYRDPLYFSRVFKSVNGFAPSDYRVAQRGMTNKTEVNGGRLQNVPEVQWDKLAAWNRLAARK